MKAQKWYGEALTKLGESLASGKITEESWRIAVWELNADLKTKLSSPTGRHDQVWQVCRDALIRIEFLEAKIRELESDHD